MAKPGRGAVLVEAPEDVKKPVTVEEPYVPDVEPEQALATVPQETTALAKVDLAADAAEFQDEFDRNSIQIPFLQILQSNSPQVKPGEGKYIENAKQGQFVETLTGETFNNLEVVPVYHYATYIEWVPREKGGGFVKDHGLVDGARLLNSTQKNEKGQNILPNGNQLVQTETYFVLLIKDGDVSQAMCTMTSTQLKKARNWNSRIMTVKVDTPQQGKVRAPMFFNSYIFKTVLEKNEKGSWYGYQIEDGRPTITLGERVYLAAREYRRVVQAGVRAGQVSFAGAETETAGSTEDVPF